MTKGAYSVADNNPQPPRKDTSFRSFICALLIFLIICLIILLASIDWGKSRRSQPGYEHVGEQSSIYKKQVEVVGESPPKLNKTHEKIGEYDDVTTSTRKTVIKEVYEDEFGEDKEEVTKGVEKSVSTTTEYHSKEIVGEEVEEGKKGVTEAEEIVTTISSKKILTDEFGDETSTDSLTTTKRSKLVEEEEFSNDTETATKSIDVDATSTDSITTTKRSKNVEGEEFSNDTETATKSIDVDATSTDSIITTKRSKNVEEEEFGEYTETATKSIDVDATSTDSITTTKRSKNVESEEFGEDTEGTTKSINVDVTSTDSVTTIRESKEIEEQEVTGEAEVDVASTDSTTTTEKSKEIEIEVTTKSESVEAKNENMTTTDSENEYGVDSTTKIDVNETIDGTTTSNLTNITTTSSPVIVKLNQSQTSTDVTTESIAPTPLPKSPKQCNSKNCKIAASQILGKMDHSTEPCVDFYEFACGRANQFETYSDSDIFEKLTIDSSSPKFTQVFKNFSNSCLEYENNFFYQKRMEGLERLIGEVGDFRIGNSTPTNLTELVSLLIMRQSMPLFDIGIDVDKKTVEFILQLTIPEQSFLHTGIPQWSGLYLLKDQCLRQQNSKLSGSYVNLDEIYKSFQECQKNHGSYIDSIENVIRSLSVFSKLDSETLLKAIKGIRFSIEYDILDQLKELPSQETIMMNFGNKNYVLKKISELQSEFKIFDWKKLFEILTGKEIGEDMLVQVYFIDYFQIIFNNLLKVDNKELNNAFLAIYAYDLFINTVVPKEASHRNHFCLDLSKKLLPDIFSYFVGKTIPNNQNNKIKNLFENLQKNFCENLSNAEWVDSASRNSVVKKCRNLNLTFYEPPNENFLIKNFENFKLTTDYQLDLIHLLENLKQRIYSLAGTPLDPEKVFSYFLNPLSTNPKTFYASPIIMVPLGLSQLALDGLPNYLVQARVGFALARQLAHHFDSTGVQYGLKLVSIANSTYKEFVISMTTLMDYESPRLYQNKNISFHINGSLSINERVVDNAAFRLIFDSITWSSDQVDLPWISGDYSRQKVFFIATAQEFCKKTTILDFMLQVFEERHLPAVLRVKNIMGNSENFAEIFSCPEGSAMDSTLKIQFPFLEPVDEEEEYQNIQEK